MSDEWGPWIEHDGKGCPCLGAWAQTERLGVNGRWADGADVISSRGNRALIEGRILHPENWDWSKFGQVAHGQRVSKVLRYRIRKPRGLTILEGLLANLPEKVSSE